MSDKAIFLDKDGTLIPDIPYNVDTRRITLTKGVARGLPLLEKEGYKLFIISNQPGLAYGYFDEQALENVRKKIALLLKQRQVNLSGFYYCPHHPEGSVAPYNRRCNCRKPLPGLILKAARENNIDLDTSWMIGDILNDVEAGKRSGCKTVLINNGNETEWEKGMYRVPDFIAADLEEAAAFILRGLGN